MENAATTDRICSSCLHWEEIPEEHKKYYPEPQQSWGYCILARTEHGKSVYKQTLAMAVDNDEYEASLFTSPSFECVQFTVTKSKSI